jgi:hypothetical protein
MSARMFITVDHLSSEGRESRRDRSRSMVGCAIRRVCRSMHC